MNRPSLSPDESVSPVKRIREDTDTYFVEANGKVESISEIGNDLTYPLSPSPFSSNEDIELSRASPESKIPFILNNGNQKPEHINSEGDNVSNPVKVEILDDEGSDKCDDEDTTSSTNQEKFEPELKSDISEEYQAKAFQREIRKHQELLRFEKSNSLQALSSMEEQLLSLKNEKVVIQRELLSLRSEVELGRNHHKATEIELNNKKEQYEKLQKQFEISTQSSESKLNVMKQNEEKLRSDIKQFEHSQLESRNIQNVLEDENKKMKQELSHIKINTEKYRLELDESLNYHIKLFQDEMKRFQISLHDEQMRSSKIISKLEEELLPLRNEKIIYQRDLSTLHSEIEDYKLRIQGLEQELLHKTNQYDQQRRHWDGLRTDYDSKLNDFHELESKYRSDCRRYEITITDLTEKLQQQENDLIKTKQELMQLKKLDMETRTQMMVQYQARIDSLEEDVLRLQQSLKSEENRNFQMKLNIEDLESQLESDRNNANQQILILRTELERSKSLLHETESELSSKCSQFDQQRKQWNQLRNDLEVENTRLLGSESRFQTDIRRYEETIANMSMKNDHLESELTSKDHTIRRLKDEIMSLSSNQQEFQSKYENLFNENGATQKLILSLKSEIESYRSKAESLEYDFSLKNQQLEQQRRHWDNVKSDLEAQVTAYMDSESKLRNDWRRSELVIIDLTEKIQNYETDLNKTRQELSSMRKNESDLKVELQSSYEIKNNSLQNEIKRLQQQVKDEQNHFDHLRGEYDSENQQLRLERNNLQQELYTLRSELNVNQATIAALEQDNHQRVQYYENLRLQLEESLNDASSRTSVSADNEARLRFEIRQFEGTIADLSRRLESCDMELKSVMMQNTRLKEELADVTHLSRREEVKYDDLMAEKLTLQKQLGILTSECELYRCRAEALDQDLSQKQHDHERQRRLWESSRVALEAQLTLLTESENHLRKDLRKAEQTIEDLIQKNSELDLQHRNYLIRKDEYDSNTTLRIMRDAQKQTVSLEEEVVQYKLKCEQLRKELNQKDEFQSQFQTLQMKYNTLQIESKSLESENESLHNRLNALQDESFKKLQDQVTQNRLVEANKSALEGQITKLNESENKYRIEKLKLEQNYELILQKNHEYELQLDQLQRELSTLKKSEAEARAAAFPSKMDLQLQSLRTEVQTLQHQLKEEQNKSKKSSHEFEVQRLSLENEKNSLSRELALCKSEIEVVRSQAEQRETDLSRDLFEQESKHVHLLDEISLRQLKLKIAGITQLDSKLSHELEHLWKLNSNLLEKGRKDEENVAGLKSEAIIYKKAYERAIEEMKSLTGQIQDEQLQRYRHSEHLQTSYDQQLAISDGKETPSRDGGMKLDLLRIENIQSQKTIAGLMTDLDLAKRKIESLEKSSSQRTLDRQNFEALKIETDERIHRLVESESRLKGELELQSENIAELKSQLEKVKRSEAQWKLKAKESSDSNRVDDILADSRSKWDDHRQMLQREVQRLTNHNLMVDNELNEAKHTIQELGGKLEKLKKENKSKLSYSETEIDVLKKKLETIEFENNQLKEINRHKSTSPISSEQQKYVERLQSEVLDLREALASSQGRHNDDIETFHRTESVLRDTIERLETDKSDCETRIMNLQNHLTLRDRHGPNAEVDILRKEVITLNEIIQNIQRDLRESEHRVDALTEQKLQMSLDYEEQIARLESDLRDVKVKLSSQHNKTIASDKQGDWEFEKLHLERELRKAEALIRILKDEKDASSVSSAGAARSSRGLRSHSERPPSGASSRATSPSPATAHIDVNFNEKNSTYSSRNGHSTSKLFSTPR